MSRAMRASLAALVAATMVTPSFADQNDNLSPWDTRRRNIDAVTHGAAVCTKDPEQFTDYQYTWYIMNAMREQGLITMSGGVLEGTTGSMSEQLTRLAGELLALNRCRFDMNARRGARFALASCISLKNQMKTIDEDGRYLRQKSLLTHRDLVAAIEGLLPAAQACRDKLGKCFNPNNKQQAEYAQILYALEYYIRDLTANRSLLKIYLPPCSKTYKPKDQIPQAGDQEALVYVNTASGDPVFWSGVPGGAGK
ncbi:MAG: hypothetical protein QM698_03975 [Micropepsaceae bacterium]